MLSYSEDPIYRITFYQNLAGEHARSFASAELLVPPERFEGFELTKLMKEMGILNEGAECVYSEPKSSFWPLSFNEGYTESRKIEERTLTEKFRNLVC